MQSVRSCAHRLVPQVMLEIAGQCCCSRVAPRRLSLHRLGDDVVQIARKGARTGGRSCRSRGSRQFLVQHITDELVPCQWPRCAWMCTGQQNVEDQAERIDIRGRGDGFAQQLLGYRVLRSERMGACQRQIRSILTFEELCDSEVEELHRAVARHEDVARLDVPMNDQVRVRVADGRQDIQEEPQPRLHVERMAGAVGIDRLTFHVLQGQIRLAAFEESRIEQPCNVGMVESRQQQAFQLEALLSGAPEPGRLQELHGNHAFNRPSARRARHTLPIPPRPISASITYAPMRWPTSCELDPGSVSSGAELFRNLAKACARCADSSRRSKPEVCGSDCVSFSTYAFRSASGRSSTRSRCSLTCCHPFASMIDMSVYLVPPCSRWVAVQLCAPRS